MAAGRDGQTLQRASVGLCCALLVLFSALSTAKADETILILDASRSMWGEVARKSKFRMVHDAFARALQKDTSSASQLGLVVFGSTSPSRCSDVTVQHKPGTASQIQLLQSMQSVNPWGVTPIAAALKITADAFMPAPDAKRIVLLADGLENCGGDPCAVARELKANIAGLTIDVVALRIAKESHAALSCIADATGGTFHTASTQAELNTISAGIVDQLQATTKPLLVSGVHPVPNTAAPENTGPSPTLLTNPPRPLEHPNALVRKLARLKPRSKPAPEVPPIPVEVEPEQTTIITARDTIDNDTKPLAADPLQTASIPTPEKQQKPPTAEQVVEEPPSGEQVELSVEEQEMPSATTPRIKPELDVESKPSEKNQGIKLRAKLTSEMRMIGKPLQWTVYRVEDAAQALWKQVAAIRSAEPTFKLDPGTYLVRARYGYVAASKMIAVGEGKLTDATFVLNAGGLRILSHLVFVDTPAGTKATHFVYTGDTDENGMRQLIAKSQIQGEIIRLNAGRYRVISRLGDANSVVATDVEVSPGVLTAVEVNHKAGVLNLKIDKGQQSATATQTNLVVFDADGKLVLRSQGAAATAILAPGAYTVSVEQSGKKATHDLDIRIGENKAVSLSPQ